MGGEGGCGEWVKGGWGGVGEEGGAHPQWVRKEGWVKEGWFVWGGG